MSKCPGPAFCPFSSEKRFAAVIALIAFLMVLMSAVAILAIAKGKDGVITGAVCSAMTAAVTTVLVGGLHRHAKSLKESVTSDKEPDTAKPDGS
jgi:ATP/ADP translocase